MALAQLALVLLGATVLSYWGYVAYMVRRVSRRTAPLGRILVPAQRLEQAMWLVWVPLVGAWLLLPWAALLAPPHSTNPWLTPPAWARSELVAAVRLLAAFAAGACFALSIRCWRHMGRQWRMGVDPAQQSELLSSGPFAYVRHPIYALSIAMMFASVLVLPAGAMVLIATIHVGLMNLKAWNEERFLLDRYGERYAAYRQEVARFLPFVHG